MAQICQIVDKHSLLLSILHWNNGYFSVTLLTPSLKSILPFCRTLFYRPIVPFCWTLFYRPNYCPSVGPFSTDLSSEIYIALLSNPILQTHPLKSIFPFLRTESDDMENKKAFHGRMSNFYINHLAKLIDLSTYEERNKKKQECRTAFVQKRHIIF